MPKENIYNDLYELAKKGKHFSNLMPLVLSRENILLAYRNIKNNTGSNTAGTDKLTMTDIGKLTPEEVTAKVRYIVSGTKRGYRPKPVRRKDIPKPNGTTRPLGIPCIYDRLIQQCFKQILEPICEAHFSKNSYGFRPTRSVEHAIAAVNKYLQHSHLHYVIEFDIKGFFDNVNHSKLIRQMWTLGIRDKHLLCKINELDHWVVSNWEENPVAYNYYINENGGKYSGFRAMRKTKLKEMYIVRYADDFRILCRTRTATERTKIAQALKQQIKHIARPRTSLMEEIWQYNKMVMGMQNYYRIATCVNLDFARIAWQVDRVRTNRLKGICYATLQTSHYIQSGTYSIKTQ